MQGVGVDEAKRLREGRVRTFGSRGGVWGELSKTFRTREGRVEGFSHHGVGSKEPLIISPFLKCIKYTHMAL